MIKLLKIEWLKMKHYTAFVAIGLIFLVCVFGVSFIAYTFNKSAQESPAAMLVGSYFTFPNVWHTVSWLSNFTLFLPGLLIILMITNEFTYKTHRQNIIDGWSRNEFIAVKIAIVFIFSALATLWVFMVALTIGLISGGAFLFDKVHYIGYFFIQAVSILMMALMISVLVKRAALSIAVFIAYVYILENLVGAIINGIQIKNAADPTKYTPFADLLPINATDNLVPFPFFREILNKAVPHMNIYILLGLSFAYLVGYIVITRKKFLSGDL